MNTTTTPTPTPTATANGTGAGGVKRDRELDRLNTITTTLDEMSPAERSRALAFIQARFSDDAPTAGGRRRR